MIVGATGSAIERGRMISQFSERPGSGDAKTGVKQEQPGAAQGGEWFERNDLLTAAPGQGWPVLKEEIDVGTQ
ncbi:MAG TPA: hypothetical protein PKM22_08030, partial [Candidatus Hydrogenedentes bacterium]|nr:hypothetical protein [Candidatus Hydrogenedentota bacterium]